MPENKHDGLEVRLRDLEGWARESEGTSNQRWKAQSRENERCEEDRTKLRTHINKQFGMVFGKLTKLETKVAGFAAGAALVGAAAAKYLLP